MKELWDQLPQIAFIIIYLWIPQKGHDEIRAYLEPFIQMASNIEWIVHNIAEDSKGTVLTERTDRFEINGQWMDILVMGGNGISRWINFKLARLFRYEGI